MYVVFEGIDGSGKSTLRRRLDLQLTRLGYTPIALFEPSYGSTGREARRLIADEKGPDRELQLELFTRDRFEHVRDKIEPLLAFKHDHPVFVLLQERGYLSFPAYQGRTVADCPKMLAQHQAIAPKPDLFIYLDLDVSTALKRIQLRDLPLDLFETERHLTGVLERYRWLASSSDENIVTLDADQTEDALADQVFDAIQQFLQRID